MPNSLGRRRGGENAEVSKLKQEIEELKSNYARDMALIGNDIRELDTRIPSPAASGEAPQP